MTTIRGAIIWLGLAIGLLAIDPAWSSVVWIVLATLAVAAAVAYRRQHPGGPR